MANQDDLQKPLPAGSIKIETLTIKSTVSNKELDMKLLIREFNIYEHVNRPFISANFVVIDSLALTSWFPLTGEEILTIKFSTPHPSFLKSVSLELQIYAIEEMASDTIRSEFFVIRAATKEEVKDWGAKIRKSYANKLTSEMAEDIFNEYLKVNEGLQPSSPSSGLRTFVIPNMSPSQALKMLAKHSKSERYPVSNFVFFQNCDGFYFKTLDEMIQPDNQDATSSLAGKPQDKYYPIHFDTGNFKSQTSGHGEIIKSTKPYEFLKMHSFEFPSIFNFQKLLAGGALESTARIIDPVTSKYELGHYNYFNDFGDFKHTTTGMAGEILSKSNPYMGTPDSRSEFFVTNHNWETAVPDTTHEFILKRSASLALLDNIIVDVTVPGDASRRVSDVVNLQFPEFGATDDVIGEINKYISGEYLIVALRHMYNSTGYVTNFRAVKNVYQRSV